MNGNRRLRIFAYYYPWYRGVGDDKWKYNQEFAPLLGHYESSDPTIVRKHVEWAVEYGIDAFIVEWFGQHPLSGGVDIDQNLRLLRDVLADYPQVKFAIFYDQLIRFGSKKNLSFFDQGRRNIFREDMRYAARTYFGHPNYLHIDGRPVVTIYITRSAKHNYDSLLEEVRSDAENEGFPATYLIGDEVWWSKHNSHVRTLDAVTAYNLHSSKKLREVKVGAREFARHMVQLYVKDQHRTNSMGVDLFPGIGHAFNDFRGNLPLIPTRPEGQFPHYKGDMVEIMKSMQDVWRDNTYFHRTGDAVLFINSFNEWPERSVLEPTLEIESFNTFNDFRNGQTVYMQPPGFEYLEGVRYGREVVERDILPNI
jgi:hypothetical protein